MASTSRWESSSRPLVVRTVWVNGLRHAILTPPPSSLALAGLAGPALRPPKAATRTSSPTSTASTASDESDAAPRAAPDRHELARCLVRWKLVVGRGDDAAAGEDEGADADAEEEGDEHDDDPQPRAPALLGSYAAIYQPLRLDGLLVARPQPTARATDDVGELEAEPASSNGQDTPYRRADPGPDSNPLSERVLQWLDLAGRAADGSAPSAKACRRSAAAACPARRSHAASAVAAPRARKFYPVAASEVPGPGHDVQRAGLLSASRRSASVDASKPPRQPEPGNGPAIRTPTPPAPTPAPPPLIQTFQHVAPCPVRTCGPNGNQSRPQLHIFVPAVPGKGGNGPATAEPAELSDCESGISDA